MNYLNYDVDLDLTHMVGCIAMLTNHKPTIRHKIVTTHSKDEATNRCCLNVGSPSTTVAQH